MGKSRLRVLALFLCFAFVLPLAACKKKEKADNSSLPFSSYYSTTNTIMSVPNVMRSGFCGKGAFALTFCETEEYMDAYHKQCLPTTMEELYNLPYLPLDEQGNEIAPESFLYYLDASGEIKATYDLNKECRPSKDIRDICCTEEVCWVLTGRVRYNEGESEYSLDAFDPEKGLTKHIDIDIGSYSNTFFGFQVGSDGSFYLTGRNGVVLVIDQNGKKKETIALPETYESGAAVIWEDSLTCMGIGKELPQVLFKYDEKNKTWTETDIAVTENWNKLLVRDEKLFSIETSKITNLDKKGVSELSLEENSVWGLVDDIRFLENGELELLVHPMSDDMCILYHLAPSDKKTMESKKEFVIAGYNLIESPIPQLVEEMSLLHPEVKFVTRDYMDEIDADADWAAAKKKLYEIISLDIANGKAPDMYYDVCNDIALGEMERLGYLQDLSPYLGSLKEDEYFMDKITMGKKTPYSANLSFSIVGFMASPKYVENTDTWTYEDFYRCAEKYTDLTCVQSIYSKQTLLEKGVLAQMDMFVKDGKANFTGDDFLQLLKWTNEIGCRNDWDDYKNAELDDGLFMLDFASVCAPGNVIDYQDHVLVGYPNENGALHVVPNYLLAISATTSQKDLAGEIILYAIGEKFQSNCPALGAGAMLVNRKCWDEDFEESYKLYSQAEAAKLKKSKEEYHDLAVATVERANRYLYGYQSILDIVLEEAAVYYSGDCSAEHAAELIQNRVGTYLKETNS